MEKQDLIELFNEMQGNIVKSLKDQSETQEGYVKNVSIKIRKNLEDYLPRLNLFDEGKEEYFAGIGNLVLSSFDNYLEKFKYSNSDSWRDYHEKIKEFLRDFTTLQSLTEKYL